MFVSVYSYSVLIVDVRMILRILALSREVAVNWPLVVRHDAEKSKTLSLSLSLSLFLFLFLSFTEASVFQSFTPRTRETSVSIRMKSNNTWDTFTNVSYWNNVYLIVIVITNQSISR